MDGSNPQTETRHVLFLPLTQSQADQVERGELTLVELDGYGRAAVLVLLAVTQGPPQTLEQAERLLVSLIEAVQTADAPTLLALSEEACGGTALTNLVERAVDRGLRFLTESELSSRIFLKHGAWDWGFQRRHATPFEDCPSAEGTFKASSDQHRTLRVALAEPDEIIHVHGYGGTGKTHLIHLLTEFSREPFTYIAPLHNQRDALATRIGSDNIRVMSLAQLTVAMTAHLSPRHKQQTRSARHEFISDAELATLLDFPRVDGRARSEVVAVCHKAVQRFCFTVDDAISDRHFFGKVPPLSAHMAMWVACAQRLWDFIINDPHPLRRATRRAYHSVKFIALSGMEVPESYGALIVDEAHDLSAPWRQILQRGCRGLLMLGDNYQYLGSRMHESVGQGRHRFLSQSVRVGQSAAGLINDVLSSHPVRPQVEFVGSLERNTKIRPYGDLKLGFVQRGLVLFSSLWSLLAYLQRTVHRRARFRVLQASAADLVSLVSGMDDLRNRGTRPSQYLIQKYGSWDALRDGLVHDPAAGAVVDLLDKGYTRQKLQAVLATQCEEGGRDVIVMGLAEHGKNIEADTVVLTPDLFQSRPRTKARDQPHASLIYLALSRARYEMWVPDFAREWLQDLRRDTPTG